MSLPSPVAIIGLGLMGGSLARDLAAAGVTVMGYDRNPAVLARAREEGIVIEPLDSSYSGLDRARLVVIATPVDATLSLIDRIAAMLPSFPEPPVVTDLGSTKVSIVECAGRSALASTFVGSHPLAGDHRMGWEASRAALFAGVTVFVCPTSRSTPEAVDRVRDLWSAVGANPTLREPHEHDQQMAWISHLPQLLSSALAVALREAGRSPAELGPGGRDMTRLAASSPEMWSAISHTNSVNLRAALHTLQRHLDSFDVALRDDDGEAILELLRLGRDWAL